jgi:hypothetical protein
LNQIPPDAPGMVATKSSDSPGQEEPELLSTALPIEIFGDMAHQRLGLLAEQPHKLEMVPRILKIKVF